MTEHFPMDHPGLADFPDFLALALCLFFACELPNIQLKIHVEKNEVLILYHTFAMRCFAS